MEVWWEGLGLLGQVFVLIATPATVVLIIQLILSVLGIGGGAEAADGADGLDGMDGADGLDGADGADADIPGIYGDGDISSPEPGIGNTDAGLRLFTLRGIVAFFAVGGWAGAVAAERGLSPVVSSLIAFGAGAIALVLIALLFRGLMKLQSDGTADIRNALGVSGVVYLTIPALRKGNGKVNIMLQDSYTELLAVTDEKEELPSGSEITVVGLSGSDTVVVKRK